VLYAVNPQNPLKETNMNKDDEPLIKKVYSRKHPISMDIVISDAHIGHKTGIVYPDKLEDYKPNDMQKWLWKVWDKEFLPTVKKIKKKIRPKYTHLLVGGDMGDLDWKQRAVNEYWATSIEVIKDNAFELLEPLFNMVDNAHVLKGTKAHTGGQLDEAIAKNFDNVIPRNEFHSAHYKVRYEYSNVYVEAQHKGVNRGRWSKRSLLESLRSRVIQERAEKNRRIPDMSYRFHFHHGLTTDLDEPFIFAQVPSWQLPNGYIAEIDPVGRTPEVGGLVVLYQDGKVVDCFKLFYTYEEDEIWRPK
jgi:hypothetical protein